jgi:glutathione S-transferase
LALSGSFGDLLTGLIETNHLPQQPFGQVSFLTDDGIEMFESGAGLLHLARESEVLLPRAPVHHERQRQAY